jgi:hypothetical protein
MALEGHAGEALTQLCALPHRDDAPRSIEHYGSA